MRYCVVSTRFWRLPPTVKRAIKDRSKLHRLLRFDVMVAGSC
jgi:hypothetical protein